MNKFKKIMLLLSGTLLLSFSTISLNSFAMEDENTNAMDDKNQKNTTKESDEESRQNAIDKLKDKYEELTEKNTNNTLDNKEENKEENKEIEFKNALFNMLRANEFTTDLEKLIAVQFLAIRPDGIDYSENYLDAVDNLFSEELGILNFIKSLHAKTSQMTKSINLIEKAISYVDDFISLEKKLDEDKIEFAKLLIIEKNKAKQLIEQIKNRKNYKEESDTSSIIPENTKELENKINTYINNDIYNKEIYDYLDEDDKQTIVDLLKETQILQTINNLKEEINTDSIKPENTKKANKIKKYIELIDKLDRINKYVEIIKELEKINRNINKGIYKYVEESNKKTIEELLNKKKEILNTIKGQIKNIASNKNKSEQNKKRNDIKKLQAERENLEKEHYNTLSTINNEKYDINYYKELQEYNKKLEAAVEAEKPGNKEKLDEIKAKINDMDEKIETLKARKLANEAKLNEINAKINNIDENIKSLTEEYKTIENLMQDYYNTVDKIDGIIRYEEENIEAFVKFCTENEKGKDLLYTITKEKKSIAKIQQDNINFQTVHEIGEKYYKPLLDSCAQIEDYARRMDLKSDKNEIKKDLEEKKKDLLERRYIEASRSIGSLKYRIAYKILWYYYKLFNLYSYKKFKSNNYYDFRDIINVLTRYDGIKWEKSKTDYAEEGLLILDKTFANVINNFEKALENLIEEENAKKKNENKTKIIYEEMLKRIQILKKLINQCIDLGNSCIIGDLSNIDTLMSTDGVFNDILQRHCRKYKEEIDSIPDQTKYEEYKELKEEKENYIDKKTIECPKSEKDKIYENYEEKEDYDKNTYHKDARKMIYEILGEQFDEKELENKINEINKNKINEINKNKINIIGEKKLDNLDNKNKINIIDKKELENKNKINDKNETEKDLIEYNADEYNAIYADMGEEQTELNNSSTLLNSVEKEQTKPNIINKLKEDKKENKNNKKPSKSSNIFDDDIGDYYEKFYN